MGKKGKKAQAGKPKKLTPKDIGKRLDALVKKLEEELKGAEMFAPLPPMEDCPICCVRLSHKTEGSFYQSCCGKSLCRGCLGETLEFVEKENEKNCTKKRDQVCPFCREPVPPDDEEYLRRLEARSPRDHVACCILSSAHFYGENGLPEDPLKALDCLIQGVELGSPEACNSIGHRYRDGKGVSRNMERAALFYRASSQRGCISGRHNIGVIEYYERENHELGIRHWKISAEAGHQRSMNELRDIYNAGADSPGCDFIGKDYLGMIYRKCHNAQEEETSEEREKHSEYTASRNERRAL